MVNKMQLTLLVMLIMVPLVFAFAEREKIPAPEDVLGFKVGEDSTLADWPAILDYFERLASVSDRVQLIALGSSTQNRPMIMAVITSKSNMKRLDEIRDIQHRLHDPRGLKPEDKASLIRKGRAVVFIGCSQHADEIAATQMSMELAYRLASEESAEIRKILDETVLLLVPSMNPDGHEIVTDWYERIKGTPYESKESMPWLYHQYVGHNINRDWFMTTQVETQRISKVLYQEWFPLLVYDVHQMWHDGPRYFLPPYYNPVNPNLDPLLISELNILSTQAVSDLLKAGKTGIAQGYNFELWRGMGGRSVPLRHNAMGILSEAASVDLATPKHIKKEDLKFKSKGFRGSGKQTSYLDPWEGGWWRIRDIIDYELITAFSFLGNISNDKEHYLSNYSLLAERQIEMGGAEPPYAYIVPKEQDDLPTAFEMFRVLQRGGADIYESLQAFEANGVSYPAGTFVIPLDQPYRAFIKDLMEVKPYPLMQTAKGTPELPRDEIAWTLPLQMGVKSVEIRHPLSVEMRKLSEMGSPASVINGEGEKWFLFANRENNGSMLINRLFKENCPSYFSEKPFRLAGEDFPSGSILLSSEDIDRNRLLSIAGDLGLTFYAVDDIVNLKICTMKKQKIGIYQSYVANMDEGWLRWALDRFEFSYTILHNEDIRAGNLNQRFTYIIIPNMTKETLIEGLKEEDVFPEYAGGIGDGVEKLKEFVHNGGRLIAMARSVDFVISDFELPVKNLVHVKSLKDSFENPKDPDEMNRQFFCPGGLLKCRVDAAHPVGFGMRNEWVLFNYFSPAFETDSCRVIVSYPEEDPLLSGILLNGKIIHGKAAVVECDYGAGSVLLFGFKVIHRAQAWGTFKMMFNAFLYPDSQ